MNGDFEKMKAGCVRVRVLAGHLREALTDLRGVEITTGKEATDDSL